MAVVLLGLGSNLGDREAALSTAIAEIAALPDVQLMRRSDWHQSQPVGGPARQGEFLNGAALVETSVAPLPLLDELRNIESRHGRQSAPRWSPRPLDIDLLLYANEVTETEMLTLPHPRMSFRRFVLEPAAQVAPRMLHPVIGWPIERLLLHVNQASDLLAIVSPSDVIREHVCALLNETRGARPVEAPRFDTVEHHWPSPWTSWLQIPASLPANRADAHETNLPYAAAAFPKLSILLDADIAHRGADKLQWATLVRQPGRGPSLRLQTSNWAEIEAEVVAAIDSVWPDLVPPNSNRLQSK